MARLIDADKLKQDHFMSDECETCINDVGRCQNWHSYTKMDFCGWIDDAPTVDPVRYGKWINDKGIYKCTACNDLCLTAGWAHCIPEKQMYEVFKFCPNCGAKMEEMDEVEDGT